MKKKNQWKTYILIAAAYLVCCLLSRYDTAGRLWFVNLAVLLSGGWYLLHDLKPEFAKEIETLKSSSENKAFVSAFFSAAIPIALILWLLVIGYTGSLRSDIAIQGATFFEAILNGAVVLFGLLMISVPFGILLMFLLGLISWLFGGNSTFGISIFATGWAFLILCHLCGLVDFSKIIGVLSSILDLLR